MEGVTEPTSDHGVALLRFVPRPSQSIPCLRFVDENIVLQSAGCRLELRAGTHRNASSDESGRIARSTLWRGCRPRPLAFDTSGCRPADPSARPISAHP